MPICLLMNVLRRSKSRNSPMIQWNCAIITHPRTSRQGKISRIKFYGCGAYRLQFCLSAIKFSFSKIIFNFHFQIFPRGTIEIFIFKFHPRNVRNFHFQTVWNFIFNFNFIIAYPAYIVNFIPLSWKIAQENNR